MSLDVIGTIVCRKPGWIVAAWLIAAGVVAWFSPDLTRLAAEGQARMLASGAESRRAAELVRQCWPDQAYESLVVAVLHRPAGLTDADKQFALRLSRRFEADGRPGEVLRVIGPGAIPEIAQRLVSHDGTLMLVAVSLASSFVAPASHEAVAWMKHQAHAAELGVPSGLEIRWTGDAVIGRDYMANVKTSLDRAAVATVVLLMIVLLLVYRSFWLALVPLVTIGLSVIIARGLLAWTIRGGWEVSSLVELFLIAILFGTGTDFCLFLSWRFAEHLNRNNPVGSMRATLSRSFMPLVTSAGTIMIGLLLMGTTKFKLFSSTGPSVAMGLGLALLATLSLTPALLVLLARIHPRAFDGLAGTSTELWDRLGAAAMARPLRSWLFTILAMLPLSLLALRTGFIQDLMTELPKRTQSVEDFRLVASKFEPGMLAPLTVVLESNADFRNSEGLALIDDISRLLSHHRRLDEVRSATQPLGSPQPFSRARLSSRLGEVNAGFRLLQAGAEQLGKGLTQGAAKLRAAIWLEEATGLPLTGKPLDGTTPRSDPSVARAQATGETLASGLNQASAVMQLSQGMPAAMNLPALSRAFEALNPQAILRSKEKPDKASKPTPAAPVEGANPAPAKGNAAGILAGEIKPKPAVTPRIESPQEVLLRELTRAAEGASQIAEGAGRARREVAEILNDPVGRRALDRLLIDDQTVHEHPELLQSFAAYITPDGHRADRPDPGRPDLLQ